MKCPSKGCGGETKVTHTYATLRGFTQRVVCKKCGKVCTVKATIVSEDPRFGEGAFSIAQRMKKAGT